MILSLFTFLAFSYAPTNFCFQTDEKTYGLPNEICFKRAHWSKKEDGSSVVNLIGPEIQAMMDEILPTTLKASVTTAFINRFEECGTNIKSELFIENIARKSDVDFTDVKVRVHVRYTEAGCDNLWKTASIHYKLVK